jgi:hypothetical protein
MFSYSSLVPWWARALVVAYEAGALLIPVAVALLVARRWRVRHTRRIPSAH